MRGSCTRSAPSLRDQVARRTPRPAGRLRSLRVDSAISAISPSAPGARLLGGRAVAEAAAAGVRVGGGQRGAVQRHVERVEPDDGELDDAVREAARGSGPRRSSREVLQRHGAGVRLPRQQPVDQVQHVLRW